MMVTPIIRKQSRPATPTIRKRVPARSPRSRVVWLRPTTYGGAGDAAPDVRQPGCTQHGCSRRAQAAALPEPGDLRPMARALLSVADEVQAARCDPLGAGGGGFGGPFSRHS